MSEILSHLHASFLTPSHCDEMPWGWQSILDILMVMDNTLVRTRNRGVLKPHLTPSLGRPCHPLLMLTFSPQVLALRNFVNSSPKPLESSRWVPSATSSSSCLAWKTWKRTLYIKHLIGRSEMCFPAACLLCRQGWDSWGNVQTPAENGNLFLDFSHISVRSLENEIILWSLLAFFLP